MVVANCRRVQIQITVRVSDTSSKANCKLRIKAASMRYLLPTRTCESGSKVLSEIVDRNFLKPAVIFKSQWLVCSYYRPEPSSPEPKNCKRWLTQAWKPVVIYEAHWLVCTCCGPECISPDPEYLSEIAVEIAVESSCDSPSHSG